MKVCSSKSCRKSGRTVLRTGTIVTLVLNKKKSYLAKVRSGPSRGKKYWISKRKLRNSYVTLGGTKKSSRGKYQNKKLPELYEQISQVDHEYGQIKKSRTQAARTRDSDEVMEASSDINIASWFWFLAFLCLLPFIDKYKVSRFISMVGEKTKYVYTRIKEWKENTFNKPKIISVNSVPSKIRVKEFAKNIKNKVADTIYKSKTFTDIRPPQPDQPDIAEMPEDPEDQSKKAS